MSYTIDQLQKLKDAYASGVLEVRFGNEKIVYKSNRDMLEAIATIERELGMRKSQAPRAICPTFGKGL